uniref:ATP-dependent DNA helicase n=1 Tax=Theileria annulata TaxID=5874 RepID=A0A3B0MYG8_THEAN
MDSYKILSESISFFALKKTIDHINLITKYFSNDNSVRWEQLVNSLNETQQFINVAVKSSFPNDDLIQYRINLPQQIQTKIELNDESSINYNIENNQNNLFTDSLPDENEEEEPHDSNEFSPCKCSEENNTEYLSKRPSESSIVSTEEGSTELELDEDLGLPEIQREQQKTIIVDMEPEENDTSALPKIQDHLSQYRTNYMNIINSKSLDELYRAEEPEVLNKRFTHLFNNNFPFSEKVQEINKNVFGHNTFRGVQLPAINSILLGHDCFVLMATGFGKSHCYQLPALILNGTVVVFSPLLSLVEDQMKSLKRRNINAETLNSKTTLKEFKRISEYFTDYNTDFSKGSILFITPEKLDKSKKVVDMLEQMYDMNRLKLFVIDEVHCVSQWGHSFRRDYRKLCNLKYLFPRVPILAMTATATPDVVEDITSVLGLHNYVMLKTTINRPNLWIEVRDKRSNIVDEIVLILMMTSGCVIIYCLTTGDCDRLNKNLLKRGIYSVVYHAKMDIKDRLDSQHKWNSGESRIIIATVAFGMGIDKPDVRMIMHTSAPFSLLSYYQEIGRAGRDGKFSVTILWYNSRDFERHKNMHDSDRSFKKRYSSYSSEIMEYCKNKTKCRRVMILEAFGEQPTFGSCFGCDNCCLNLSAKVVDVSDEAVLILKFVKAAMEFRNKGFLTAIIISDAMRGSKRKIIVKYKLNENPYHGTLNFRNQKYIIEVILLMVKQKVLKDCRRKSKNFGRTVLIPGQNASQLLKGDLKIEMTFYGDPMPVIEIADSVNSKANFKVPAKSVKTTRSTNSSANSSGKKSAKSRHNSIIPMSCISNWTNSDVINIDENYTNSKSQVTEIIDDSLDLDDTQIDRVIDLTLDNNRPHDVIDSTNEYIEDTSEPIINMTDENIISGLNQLTQSDILTVETNNIRRKIPDEMMDPS